MILKLGLHFFHIFFKCHLKNIDMFFWIFKKTYKTYSHTTLYPQFFDNVDRVTGSASDL